MSTEMFFAAGAMAGAWLMFLLVVLAGAWLTSKKHRKPGQK
jgi:arginine exporter protein ArgO